MSQIVETDNFCRDYPNERFILWSMPEEYAQQIADILNKLSGPNGARYYMVKPNDYVLKPGFEP